MTRTELRNLLKDHCQQVRMQKAWGVKTPQSFIIQSYNNGIPTDSTLTPLMKVQVRVGNKLKQLRHVPQLSSVYEHIKGQDYCGFTLI